MYLYHSPLQNSVSENGHVTTINLFVHVAQCVGVWKERYMHWCMCTCTLHVGGETMHLFMYVDCMCVCVCSVQYTVVWISLTTWLLDDCLEIKLVHQSVLLGTCSKHRR